MKIVIEIPNENISKLELKDKRDDVASINDLIFWNVIDFLDRNNTKYLDLDSATCEILES